VQIPPNIIKCVVFLGTRLRSEIQYIGTAFLVGYELEERDHGATECYAVTARHVIEAMNGRDLVNGGPSKCASIDNCSHFRLNTRQHGCSEISLPLSEWIFHPDDRIDVAVACMPDFDGDHLWIPRSMLLSTEKAAHQGIGPGDELFFPGLFTRHVGTSANVPIIRTGNIAAMPTEPVQTPLGKARSYLAEARSIAGLSGSPVFVVQERGKIGEEYVVQLTFPTYWLLGMAQGHYGAGSLLDSDDKTMGDAWGHKSVNIGISFVTPADSILEVLDDPRLAIQRAEHFKEILAKRADNGAELD
jgi:hypothetical protein